MKFVGICSAVIALVFSIFGSSQGFAAKDKNGIEEKGIYNITMDIGGKPWAWTHVVPADRPKNLIGTNPKAEKVELKPLVKGEKSQQWKIRTEIEGKWIYHVYSMMSAPSTFPISRASSLLF
jgi:hypothetical protein